MKLQQQQLHHQHKGCKSNSKATGAKTGNSTAVVAKFDVTSVRKLIAAANSSNKISRWKAPKAVNCLPIQESQSTCFKSLGQRHAATIEQKNTPWHFDCILPQENFSFLFLALRTNKTKAKNMAMIVSSMEGKIV